MDSVILVSKSEKNVFSKEEVIKAFNEATSLDGIKDFVDKAEDRLYTSWATVDSVDKDKQRVPIEEAIKQQDILMERNAPIRAGHKLKDVGKTLAYRVLTHPITGTTGILHLNQIYNHNVLDNEMWTNVVQKGEGGSSVGGFATDTQMVSEGRNYVEELQGFNWLETTLTDKPRNQYSTGHAFSQVAKSEEKMVEKLQEVKKEGEEDVSTETTESSVEDRVQALEEGLGMALSKLDEVIAAVAGTPEVEKEAEEPKKEEDGNPAIPEDEKVEKEEDEEPKKEDDEVAKSLKTIADRMTNLEKKLNVVEVVKSEMPTQVNKADESKHDFTDVMKGKISLEEFNRGTQ